MIRAALMSYLELDGFCLVVLLLIFRISSRRVENRKNWDLYRFSLLFLMLVIVTDALWALMEAHVLPAAAPLPLLVNSVYYICATLTAAFWFFFTEAELDVFRERSPVFRALLLVPLLSTAALLVANCFNQCLFSFDEQGRFVRGPLTIEIYLIPLIYLLLSAVHPLIRARRGDCYVHRKNYLSLAAFALISISAVVLQFFLPGTPLPCLGMSLASLLVFMNRQEMLISLDPLTRLNNRQQMIYHLNRRLEDPDEGRQLYLIILDLDHFKAINDTYGHVEGDRALVRAADVLRKAAAAFGCFISRYGGDEFILIYETEDEARVDELCQFIRQELAQAGSGKYSLTVGIGRAKYVPELRHIPAFIALADKALYEDKKARRISRT